MLGDQGMYCGICCTQFSSMVNPLDEYFSLNWITIFHLERTGVVKSLENIDARLSRYSISIFLFLKKHLSKYIIARQL